MDDRKGGFLGLGLVAAFVAVTAMACATSPTGRRQLILVPNAEMDHMGKQAYQQIKAEETVAADASVTRYVQCVAGHITAQVESEEGWEVTAFRDDDTVNAFALPGGKIGVYTGMLRVAATQSQLAAVMAHEVGHVIARHGAERTSQQLALSGGLAAVDAALGDSGTRGVVMGVLGIGAQYGVLLPYSRTHESEADAIGLELMARAGFDPQAAVQLWENMAQESGGQPPEFMSTHPSHESRIQALSADMSEAQALYQQAQAQGLRPNCTPAR